MHSDTQNTRIYTDTHNGRTTYVYVHMYYLYVAHPLIRGRRTRAHTHAHTHLYYILS